MEPLPKPHCTGCVVPLLRPGLLKPADTELNDKPPPKPCNELPNYSLDSLSASDIVFFSALLSIVVSTFP